MTLPTAFFIRVFGMSDFTCVLWNLISSLCSITIVFLIAQRLFSLKVAVVSATLLAIYPLDILEATQMYNDLPMSIFVLISVLLFVKATADGSTMNRRLLLYSGIAVGLGYLAKEQAFFVLFLYLIYELFERKSLKVRDFLIVCVGFSLVIVVEMILYGLITGNPFFRIDVIRSGTNYAEMTQTVFPTRESVANRMTYEMWSMLFNPLDQKFFFTGAYFYLLLGAVIFLFIKKGLFTKNVKLLCLWWGCIFVLTYFWPLSINPYIPALAAYPRHLVLLSAPTILLVGYVISATVSRDSIVAAILSVIAVAGIFFTSILQHNIRDAVDGVKDAFTFLQKQGHLPIYSDRATGSTFHYWSGYNPQFKLNLYDPSKREEFKNCYVVINVLWNRSNKVDYSDALEKPPSNWEKIYDDSFRGRKLIHYLLGMRRYLEPNPLYRMVIYKVLR